MLSLFTAGWENARALPACSTAQVETLEESPQRASALAASRRKCPETCRRLVLEIHLCISSPSTFEELAHSTSQWHDRWTGTKKKFQPMKLRPIAGVTCGGVRFVNTVFRSDSAFVELKSVTRYCPFFVDDFPTQEREISSLKIRGSRSDVFRAAVRKSRNLFLTVARVSSWSEQYATWNETRRHQQQTVFLCLPSAKGGIQTTARQVESACLLIVGDLFPQEN